LKLNGLVGIGHGEICEPHLLCRKFPKPVMLQYLLAVVELGARNVGYTYDNILSHNIVGVIVFGYVPTSENLSEIYFFFFFPEILLLGCFQKGAQSALCKITRRCIW